MRLQVYKEGKFVSLGGTNTLTVKKPSLGWVGCLFGGVAMFAPSLFAFPGWLTALWYVGFVWLVIRYLSAAHEKSALPVLNRLVLDTSEGLFSIESTKGEEQEVWDLPLSSIRTIHFQTLPLVAGLQIETKPLRDLPFEMRVDLYETTSTSEITVYTHVEGVRTTLDLFKFGGLLGSLLGMDAQSIQQQQQENIAFEITHDTAVLRELGTEIVPPKEDAGWLTDRLFGISDDNNEDPLSSSAESTFFQGSDQLSSQQTEQNPPPPQAKTKAPIHPTPRIQKAQQEQATERVFPQLHFPSQRHTSLKPLTPTAPPPIQQTPSKKRAPTNAHKTAVKPAVPPTEHKRHAPPAVSQTAEETPYHLPHEESILTAATTEPSASTKWQKSENNAIWPEWSNFSSSDQSKPSLNWPTWEDRSSK